MLLKRNDKSVIVQSILSNLIKKYSKNIEAYELTENEIKYMNSYFSYDPKRRNILSVRKRLMSSKKMKSGYKAFSKYTIVKNGFEYITNGKFMIRYPVRKKDGGYNIDNEWIKSLESCEYPDCEKMFEILDNKYKKEVTFQNIPDVETIISLPNEKHFGVNSFYLQHISDLYEFYKPNSKITGIMYAESIVYFKINTIDILIMLVKS